MGSDGRITVDELPPRPDSETGLPRPPHAPGYGGGDQNLGSLGFGTMPAPPPDHGRVFAWRPAGTLRTVSTLTISAVVLPGMLTLANGFEWMKHIVVWLVIVLGLFWMYLAIRTPGCVAGADWFKRGRKWVEIYELTEITYKLPLGSPKLKLQDSGGRAVTVRVKDLQGDRSLWDFVYNGMLHSIITGNAKTNEKLHLDLHFPRPYARS